MPNRSLRSTPVNAPPMPALSSTPTSGWRPRSELIATTTMMTAVSAR